MALRLFLLLNYLGIAFLLYALVQFWKEGHRQDGHFAHTGHGRSNGTSDANIIEIPRHNSQMAPRELSETPSDVKKCG